MFKLFASGLLHFDHRCAMRLARVVVNGAGSRQNSYARMSGVGMWNDNGACELECHNALRSSGQQLAVYLVFKKNAQKVEPHILSTHFELNFFPSGNPEKSGFRRPQVDMQCLIRCLNSVLSIRDVWGIHNFETTSW